MIGWQVGLVLGGDGSKVGRMNVIHQEAIQNRTLSLSSPFLGGESATDALGGLDHRGAGG